MKIGKQKGQAKFTRVNVATLSTSEIWVGRWLIHKVALPLHRQMVSRWNKCWADVEAGGVPRRIIMTWK